MSMSSESTGTDFRDGLIILLFAQFLSAFMGAFVESTYEKYGASWTENLFYTHFLSIPMFLPFASSLQDQYSKLAATPPLQSQNLIASVHETLPQDAAIQFLRTFGPVIDYVPQGIVFLLVNTITQLACISGVNLLSAKASAVTVTIVLNIRKLVSFIFSTVLFGHELSGKMIFGSVLVFGSGALYGWETSWRLPQQRKQKDESNGSLKKEQ